MRVLVILLAILLTINPPLELSRLIIVNVHRGVWEPPFKFILEIAAYWIMYVAFVALMIRITRKI